MNSSMTCDGMNGGLRSRTQVDDDTVALAVTDCQREGIAAAAASRIDVAIVRAARLRR